jgi:hypothetical protein
MAPETAVSTATAPAQLRSRAERYAAGKAIAAFSMAYADQNEKDHAALVCADRKETLEALFEDEA